MTAHWPIVAAAAIIGAAAAYGVCQRDELAQVALTPPQIAPLAEVMTKTAAKPAPAPVPVEAVVPAAPVSPVAPVPRPVAPAPVVRPAVPVVPAVPPTGLPTPAAPASAAVVVQTLAELRQAVQAKWNVASVNTANGGFSLKTTGARLEVPELANWAVWLYNENPADPHAETENFNAGIEIVTRSLGIDFSSAPIESGTRKTWYTTSKLGRVMVRRDPAGGNAYFVRPYPRTPAAAGGAVVPQSAPLLPVNPAAPVAPPKAPVETF
jgi:hypothetical protein